jgi:hypothetical protein
MTKPFSFTYSKIKNYEQCPLQHKKVDIDRTPGWEPSGDAIDYGNRVHKAFCETLSKGAPLPVLMKGLQYWVDWCNGLPGDHYVEQKWAIDRHYQPTEYFGSPWMRCNADFAAVFGPVGWLVDWKTGKRLEEPLQLWLSAMVMFSHFPQLKTIDSMFVWLKEDDGKNPQECISAETIQREQTGEIWEQMLPRIQTYEEAYLTHTFPPRPGNHCRWCRVQSCEFFGGKK